MKENNNLVLWCHGHVHHDVDLIKYGTLVVCCPFGYFNETNKNVAKYGLTIDTNEL